MVTDSVVILKGWWAKGHWMSFKEVPVFIPETVITTKSTNICLFFLKKNTSPLIQASYTCLGSEWTKETIFYKIELKKLLGMNVVINIVIVGNGQKKVLT
jgi:hypothetical protein